MNYTDSVPLASEKKREKILTFGPFGSAFHQPLQDQRSALQAQGKTTRDGC